MMRLSWKTGLFVAAMLVVVGSAEVAHAVIAGQANQKWEISLDGFAKLYPTDDNGTPADPDDDTYVLRNFVRTDSTFKGQGDITTGPDAGVPAEFTPGTGETYLFKAGEVSYSGILGMVTTGLKVIGVDVDDTFGTYTRLSAGNAGFAAALAGLKQADIIYFGKEDDAQEPIAYIYNDAGAVWADYENTTDGWNADGSQFTGTGGRTIGDDEPVLLELQLQDFGLHEVDAKYQAAMAGTYLASVITNDGAVRVSAIFDVIGGTDEPLVLENGMYTTLRRDTNGNGRIDAGDGGAQTSFVNDFIAAFGAKVPDSNGFVFLSDPAEYVGVIPEPGALLVWAVLCLAGLAFSRRRRS